jgi:HD-GYP domain-containing protein (c-di-GMP phosphodiesterase class II)
MCFEIIRNHHQRYDGGGYPARDSDEAPSMYTMIMGVADA